VQKFWRPVILQKSPLPLADRVALNKTN
jgi:hypothetical protein